MRAFPRTRRLLFGMLVAIAFAASPQLARAANPGSLTQLASPNNCIQEAPGAACGTTNGTALREPQDTLVSPDGKNVYVLSFGDEAIAEFARSADGHLTSVSCVSEMVDTSSTCPNQTAKGIASPAAFAISPDGANIYVVGRDTNNTGTIAEFARDPSTGLLTQLSSPSDCIGEHGAPSECGTQTGHGLGNPVAVVVSPDGQNVYVADEGGSAITDFTRNADGSLSQAGGANACIADQNSPGTDCTATGPGLTAVESVVVSPDGKNLYTGNRDNPGAIAEFARSANGSLTQLSASNACIENTGGSHCSGNRNGTGINDLIGLAVSPDGENLYASSSDGSVAELARNADGSLTQLGGNNACIEETGFSLGCPTTGRGIDGANQLIVSPDGADVYVANNSDDCGCTSDIAELARNADGSLTQLPQPDSCIESNPGTVAECPGNASGVGLGGGGLGSAGIAISPDGANVYAAGFDDIAELARAPVQFTLTVSRAGSSGSVSDGTGAISCPPTCGHAYTAGSRVTLTAPPSATSLFAGWSGSGCSGTGVCQVTMRADAAVTATFNPTGAPGVTSGKPTVRGSNGAAFSGTANPNNSLTDAFFQYGLDKRYTQPGSSGPTYTQSTPVQLVGSDNSTHLVSASVSGLLPNALYHVRLVAINAHGTSFGPDQTFTTAKGPAPPPPTIGKFFNAAPTGIVFLLENGKLVPLTENTKIPFGAILDTLHGSVTLVAASGGGGLANDAAANKGRKSAKKFTGTFGGAVFKVTQTKSGPNKGLTTLALVEGLVKGTPTYASCKAKGAADAHAALSRRILQALRSRSSGRFRTRGRYAAGTVRGTRWTTSDRCDGTLIAVQEHSVLVTDLVKHITILVRAGHHYLARAPKHN